MPGTILPRPDRPNDRLATAGRAESERPMRLLNYSPLILVPVAVGLELAQSPPALVFLASAGAIVPLADNPARHS